MQSFFPPPMLSLLQVFAPYFTAPSFTYFQAYIWALMVVEGRKCLTRLAGCVFFHQCSLSSWERFVAKHRWSVTAVTARLVRLVVERLGEQRKVHGAYVLGKDTTLVAKNARRMFGVQKWHDHSGNADRGAALIGHHWNLVGLISAWGTRWRCWPLVMRLVPGHHGARQWLVGDAVEPMTFWDAAIAAILEVTLQLGEAAVRVVADAYDATAPFFQGLFTHGIHVISRLRKDAVGWDDPEPRPPGIRGRKPRYGRKWSLAALVTAETPARECLTLYGKLTEVVFVVRDVWRRDVARKVRVVVLEGAKEPILLVGTFQNRVKVVNSLPSDILRIAGCRHNRAPRAKRSMRRNFRTGGTIRPLQSSGVGSCSLQRLERLYKRATWSHRLAIRPPHVVDHELKRCA